MIHRLASTGGLQQEEAVADRQIHSAATERVVNGRGLRRIARDDRTPTLLRSSSVELFEEQRRCGLLRSREVRHELRAILVGEEEIVLFGGSNGPVRPLQRKRDKGAMTCDTAARRLEKNVKSRTRRTLLSEPAKLLDGHAVSGQPVVFGENPDSFRQTKRAANDAQGKS